MANTQLSDALHILTYLVRHQQDRCKSTDIAASLNTNPSLVRRLMGKLRQAQLIGTQQGAVQPHLLRDPTAITIRDVYQAILADAPLLNVDHDTSRTCSIGLTLPNVLNHYYADIQATAEAKMARITLQDILDGVENELQQSS